MSTDTISVISNEQQSQAAFAKAQQENEVASPVAAEELAETADASGASENEQEEEGKEAEDTKEGDEEGEAKAPQKKKGGFQKRIDKLTAKNAELERRLNELAAKDPKPAAQVEQPKEAASGEPQEGDYETHAEYIRAITKWEIAEIERQKETKLREKSVQEEHETRVSKFGQGFQEFAKAHADAHDVINEAFEEKPMSIAVQELFLDSENGQELSYELAKNLEEWKRINSLNPLAAARALGKFEASLSKPEPKTNPNKLTKAPEPITPVGGKGRVTTEKSIYDATDDMSQAEFERLEALSRKKRA